VDQELVALDGKALRRASNQGAVPRWWSTHGGRERPELGQLKMADKSNKITDVSKLLRVLELAGCIVTLDAMACQEDIAKEIKEADADYVLALKGNQGTAFAEVKAFLDEAIQRLEKHLVTTTTVDNGHGRVNERRYWQIEHLALFYRPCASGKVSAAGAVHTVNGKKAGTTLLAPPA